MLTEPCLALWKGKSERWVSGDVGEARLSIDFRAAGLEYMVAADQREDATGHGLTTRPLRTATGRPARLSMGSITALLPRNHRWAGCSAHEGIMDFGFTRTLWLADI